MGDLITPLFGLFLLSFSSATLLPGGSEAGLLAIAALTTYPSCTLVMVASAGNILGSVANYWLGRLAIRYQDHRWFPLSPAALFDAQKWFARWGEWSILMAWVPIVGDPITVAAGVMRMSFLRFFLLVSLSKVTRYLLLLGLFDLAV